MTQTTRARPDSTQMYGGTVFAAMLMLLTGTMQLLQGIVALVNDDFYVRTQDYAFAFDLTTWGWTHLVVGAAVAATGAALLAGALWARTAAVILAGISIVVNFAWMPHYPVWSLTVIAFDVFVIWAVLTHDRPSPTEP